MNKENKKNNDEGIKAIAAALRAGGTLLNKACPVCDSPLIKINDKVYCKVCEKEVIIYQDEKELPAEIRKEIKKKVSPAVSEEESKVEKTLKSKIEKLRLQLEESDDPDEIIKLTEAIDKLNSTLKKMKDEDDDD
ncbi:MAG: Sjogren's syndrome/scleroderma autoantigen 1 family protein [Candidatus Heimdallarchaeota archaeon]